MSTMTTEVTGRNDQRSNKDRNLSFKSQRPANYDRPTDFFNPSFCEDNLTPSKDCYVPTKPMIEKYSGRLSLPTEKSYIINSHDEGYNTDSKSNTSPSTTSPLSSSFSSMSTFDGSFNSPTSPSGGISPNSPNSNHFVMHGNTQRCPAPQKLSLIQGNGKIHVNRHAFVMAKKKDSPQESQDNSPVNLEDRLRALTTIEEEEPGISNVSVRETQKKEVYIAPESEQFESRHSQPIINYDAGKVEEIRNRGHDQSSGFFRAVPVEIAAPQIPYDQRNRVENHNENPTNFRTDNSLPIPQSPGYNSSNRNWHDYQRYFEKDCDIPLHNIDALNRGKFVNAGSDNANDKDINRQLGTNTPGTRSEQVGANTAPNMQQPGFGRDAHRELNENFGSGNFQEHSRQGRAPSSQGQFHGYPQNGQRTGEHISHQNDSSVSMSELHFPYHTHLSSQSRNDNSYHTHDHTQLQQEQPQSLPHSYHYQQQFDSQQPHHQNQYFQQQQQQQHPFFNESSQQNPDTHLFNRSSGSFNSLPRHYDGQRQHPMFYSEDSNQFSENDVVLRRSWASSSTRALPDRVDRYSWHPDSRSKHPNPTSDRYSLDLGNIPQLQQQIRATSEMCLQASKRHVFASSADIYKLFQGQKKPTAPSPSPSLSSSSSNLKDFTRGQNQSNRHSFHSMPGGSWERSQQNLQQDKTHLTRDSMETPPASTRQHSLFTNNSSHPSPSPGPLRGDHSIPLPQNSWGSNNFLPPNLSSSTFPLTLSELPHIQRQSSGYSSENELQQIEQNAKAAKKSKTRNNPHSQQGVTNPDQEFVPVDPTQDHDSSSSIIENEPVYMNQPMLANAARRGSLTKSSPSQQSQLSTPPPPPLPARPQHLQQTPVTNSNSNTSGYDATSNPQRMLNTNPGVESRNVVNEPNTSSSAAVITQKQIINFSQKPVTINSFVPNHPYKITPNSANGPRGDERPVLHEDQFPQLQQLNFQSNHDQFPVEQQPGPDFLNAPKRSNSSRSNKMNGSPCTPLSPLEIAQVLDVPFATNVISDECGDRLSTLV